MLVISLPPHSMKLKFVLSEFFEDITLMSTDGFKIFDADGTLTRVFYLISIIVDSLGLNTSLYIMGHIAAVCFHLYRYNRGHLYPKGPKYVF